MDVIEAQIYFPAMTVLGEGPVWDELRDELTWVDVARGQVHTLGPDAAHRAIQLDETVGSAVPLASDDGWVVGLRSGVAMIDREGRIRSRCSIDADRPDHRMNDGACDSAGRFWTGTMSETDPAPSNALYLVAENLEVQEAITGVGLSNGIAWSPDNSSMYFVDSRSGSISRYPFDAQSGALGPPDRFAEVDPAVGEPDGLAVDSAGAVWVAIWNAGRIRRYHPDGTVDLEVLVPCARVTSCTFGGPDLRTLFITTATIGLDRDSLLAQPAAGSIFRITTPDPGLPVQRFGAPA